MARIVSLHPEYRADGFALHTGTPRLSWLLDDAAPGVTQIAYEIELAHETEFTSTGRVPSADQVFVTWPFNDLQSRARAAVRARAWMSDGEVTEWSDPLELEISLLKQSDWSEPFVSPSLEAPAVGVRQGYLLRAEFDAPEDIVGARLYATAHGIYRAHVNGSRAGNEELAPGWTSYNHRLRFQTYDVTGSITAGRNAIGIELSDGWYRGRIGFHGGVWDNYGHDLSMLTQLELTRADGSTVVVDLADAWRWSSGPVTAASLYDGERYDARLEIAGWSTPDFDDSTWGRLDKRAVDTYSAQLEPAVGVPVRVIEELAPVVTERRSNGRIRLDFGQNIAGRLRIRVAGAAGTTIRIYHAEVLEADELALRTLRTAPSIDEYTTRSPEQETWAPRFTIHGFRYAELVGWPGEIADGDVVAEVIHSDMRRTGWFDTDHDLIAQLHENTVWSMRDNFVDLPTDCPQRDERLGWTGDIQVFAPAASYLFDSGGTLASWLRDVAAEQSDTGHVPNFVPWIACGFPDEASAAWGDAAVIVPWTMYQRHGDVRILDEQFASMAAWVDHSASKRGSNGLIRAGMQLGDWLDPTAPPEDPGAGATDAYLVANAYLVESARIVAESAALLGKTGAAAHYRTLAEEARVAFRGAYVVSDGNLVNNTHTSLSLAIVFGLLDGAAEVAAAGERLARLCRDGGYRVQTGFVGTPIICDALAQSGQIDIAYQLLTETECPSWLYPVTMGATTIWERWDSMLPDGSINPGEMTSFNHYAFGAVVDFMHRVIAGLAPATPGYRKLHIAPQPSVALGRASAELDTPYGRAASGWTITGSTGELVVVVPTGVTATVVVPGESVEHEVGSGTHHFEFAMNEVAVTA
jgi:alpha-L-rhamnosidase